MTRRQRGVTMIGWIFLLVPVALVLYAGIRIGPEYLNYYKVSQALSETASKHKGDDTVSPQNILSSLQRRFDTGYIDTPLPNEILIAKGENGWEMTADWEPTVPFVGNLYLTMQFKKTVAIN